MNRQPNPAWPAIALGIGQLADATLCVRPPTFIQRCLNGVGFPRRAWPVLPFVKGAAGVGLIAGTRIPWIGAAASAGLVAYFTLAAAAHLRAGYLGRDFWVNCLGMYAWSIAVFGLCFVRRPTPERDR